LEGCIVAAVFTEDLPMEAVALDKALPEGPMVVGLGVVASQEVAEAAATVDAKVRTIPLTREDREILFFVP
jgi:hypothetical protein